MLTPLTVLEQVLFTLTTCGATALFVLLTVLAFRGRQRRHWPRTVLGVAALCAAATFGFAAVVGTLMLVGPGPPAPPLMPQWLLGAGMRVFTWASLVAKVLAIAGGIGLIVRCTLRPAIGGLTRGRLDT